MDANSCPVSLIFDNDSQDCETSDYATCQDPTSSSPPPPPPPAASSNRTTGLNLDATFAEAREAGFKSYSSNFRYDSLDYDSLPETVDWRYLFGGYVRDQGSCSKC